MRLAIRVGALAVAAGLFGFGLQAFGQLGEGPQAGSSGAASDSGEVLYRDDQAVKAFEEGVSKLQGEDYKGAVAALNAAIAIDPSFAEAFVAKGDALKALQDYEGAVKAYTTIFSLNASTAITAAAYNGRGESLMELGRYDLAINDLYSALERDRGNAKILSNIGHVLVNAATSQQDPTAPLRFLDDAIALNDQDARAYRDRGLAHVRIGEIEEGLEDLNKAIEVDPNDYENFSTMASIHTVQENYLDAIASISKAIDSYQPKKRIDPKTFVDGYLMRADLRQRAALEDRNAGQRDELLSASVEDCDQVIEVFEDRFPYNGVAYYRRGRAQRLLEDYSKAIDSFTQALQLLSTNQDPGYASEAYLYRGICFHYIGSDQLARGDFQQASGIGSGFSDPRVYLWIGYTYHLEGDYREAINWYSQAVAKNPNFAMGHVNRGRAYIDLGEYRRAIASFNDAIRTEPNNGEHYYNVAFCYDQLEEYQKAVDFYDLALLKENPQPKFYRGMADALRGLGKDDLAERYDRQAAEAEAKMQAANS